jgi:hypothetical protein
LAKRRKVAKAKHLEDKEAEWKEIPLPKTSRKPVEVSDKKKRLQEATKKFLESGASAKELIAAIAEAEAAQNARNEQEHSCGRIQGPGFPTIQPGGAAAFGP